MSYKEDNSLPSWVNNQDNEDERTFKEWYEKEFLCASSPRSARYYQMRRAWLGAKNFYSKSTKEAPVNSSQPQSTEHNSIKDLIDKDYAKDKQKGTNGGNDVR